MTFPTRDSTASTSPTRREPAPWSRAPSSPAAELAGADLRGADLGDFPVTEIQHLAGATISPDQAARLLAQLGVVVDGCLIPPA